MTTVTLYDSDEADAIPETAEAVAGYDDGTGPDFDAMAARFPGKPVVSITRSSPPKAGSRVADIETGALGPAEAAVWAREEIAAGRRPTLYYSRGNVPDVSAALTGANVSTSAVDFWVADWTGFPHLLDGTVATQYASPTTPIPGGQGHYDLSVAEESWLAASMTPAPEPGPAPVPGGGGTPTPASEPDPAPEPQGGFVPPLLKNGSFSSSVKAAQTLLNLHDAKLAVDGVFGPATEAAVRNFQTVLHLTVDGIVGPATWTALDTFG